ncbi:arginine--tRNA ligase [Bergeyella zoohelcum]|uniref:Arginine--tRNA ligase n=1 Tax=Bergeyella zoohelcum ATCC 43767 TaxID=883096 RepID=K1LH53_9FLAO|nr:arginine--tRNA ligase [Bergeyella zoohelcum]EKB56005.1 arginine-tRNA ligase [Bergeyella zoohelcum ATCC 43767]SUV50271.1 Arginine--tRNA ligase [Bergeyella zoohelcum]
MDFKTQLSEIFTPIIRKAYQNEEITIELQDTKPNFEGDFSIVTFPLVKLLKKNPEILAEELGTLLKNECPFIKAYNTIKGFLNISLEDDFFLQSLPHIEKNIENKPQNKGQVMVEYSSPNTNKPLHLGHIRNNLLGYSIAQILEADGYKVIKTQIINDRGIHISKSMYAWQEEAQGATPESTDTKGDKFVGNYYVAFDKRYKAEIQKEIENGLTEEEAKKHAPSIIAAQKMLIDWENNDEKVRQLWEMMNNWVYQGFAETYRRLGVNFDQVQYESNTYLLGKDLIQKGLDQGVFFQKEDGSVWIDLESEGLDQKLLLRKDGTSVYMTQDLGTAVQRFEENDIQKLIYTVGNEQDYHFQVLFAILKKLGYTWANHLYHLSYGMVELPHGKMKSREGTVVDADDLMQEMYLTAKEKAQELGKLEGQTEEEKEKSYEIVGMGALKYYMLKVDPKKKMLFNPAESIDFNGNTGPFIQYTFARIQSLLTKVGAVSTEQPKNLVLNASEKELLVQLASFPAIVSKAAESLSPALVANYVYDVVKTYNSFYQNNSVMNADTDESKNFRVQLSAITAKVIQKSLALLGIGTVNRM